MPNAPWSLSLDPQLDRIRIASSPPTTFGLPLWDCCWLPDWAHAKGAADGYEAPLLACVAVIFL